MTTELYDYEGGSHIVGRQLSGATIKRDLTGGKRRQINNSIEDVKNNITLFKMTNPKFTPEYIYNKINNLIDTSLALLLDAQKYDNISYADLIGFKQEIEGCKIYSQLLADDNLIGVVTYSGSLIPVKENSKKINHLAEVHINSNSSSRKSSSKSPVRKSKSKSPVKKSSSKSPVRKLSSKSPVKKSSSKSPIKKSKSKSPVKKSSSKSKSSIKKSSSKSKSPVKKTKSSGKKSKT
jgi:hypothetical protein